MKRSEIRVKAKDFIKTNLEHFSSIRKAEVEDMLTGFGEQLAATDGSAISTKDIISLLQSENTAGGSSSDAASGGYTMLGNRTQAIQPDESSQEGVKSTLGKRTDSEKVCYNCKNAIGTEYVLMGYYLCNDCYHNT